MGTYPVTVGEISPTLDTLGGTPAVVHGTAYAAGVATTFLRTDDTIKFPTSLLSAANSSTLILTDDGINQTLTGSLGSLNLQLPSAGQFVVKVDTTTAPSISAVVQARPAAGSRTALAPSFFSPASTDIFNTQVFRAWDAQMTTFAGQHTSDTIIGYDISSLTLSPSVGSGGSNNLYGFRCSQAFQISNTNATWAEVATAYFKGIRRSLSNPTITTQAACILEPPTAATSDQIGLYVRQQTAQAVATNRYGILVDVQNSGTNQWSFKGSNKVHCDLSDFIANASGFGFSNRDSQSSSAGGGGTARYWRSYVDASATGVAGGCTFSIDSSGVLSITRAGGATGTVQQVLKDVGTAAVTT